MTIQGNLILPSDADRNDWTNTRLSGIGGSDVAALFADVAASFGKRPMKTAYALFLEKTGQITQEEPGEQAYWGTRLEHIVAEEFEMRTGHGVIPNPGTLQHEEFPWMFVNVDRLVCDIDHVHLGTGVTESNRCKPTAILECKTTSVFNRDDWSDGELPYGALLQVHQAFAITGLRKAYVPALIGGQRFVIAEVERDDELVKSLIEREAEFWQRVVENNPPDIDGEECTSDLLDRMYRDVDPDKVIKLPADAQTVLAKRNKADRDEKDALARKMEANNQLKAWLGDGMVGTFAGTPLVTWKNVTKKGSVTQPTTYRQLNITKAGKTV